MNQPPPPPPRIPANDGGWGRLDTLSIKRTPTEEERRFSPPMWAHLLVFACTLASVVLAIFAGLGDSDFGNGEHAGIGIGVLVFAYLVGWVCWKFGGHNAGVASFCAVAVLLLSLTLQPLFDFDARFDRELGQAFRESGWKLAQVSFESSPQTEAELEALAESVSAPVDLLIEDLSNPARRERATAVSRVMRARARIELRVTLAKENARKSFGNGASSLVLEGRLAEVRGKLEHVRGLLRAVRDERRNEQVELERLFDPKQGAVSADIHAHLRDEATRSIGLQVESMRVLSERSVEAELALVDFLAARRKSWQPGSFGSFAFTDEATLAEFNGLVSTLGRSRQYERDGQMQLTRIVQVFRRRAGA